MNRDAARRRRCLTALEHHDRPSLGAPALIDKCRLADEGFRGILVDERVVEQTKLELLQEHPTRRLCDMPRVDQPPGQRIEDRPGIILAPKLVHPGADRLRAAFRGVEILDTPRHADVLRSHRRHTGSARSVGIAEDRPVG